MSSSSRSLPGIGMSGQKKKWGRVICRSVAGHGTMKLFQWGKVPAAHSHESNSWSISRGIFGLLHSIFENQAGLGFHLLLIEVESVTKWTLYKHFPMKEAVRRTRTDTWKAEMCVVFTLCGSNSLLPKCFILGSKRLCPPPRPTRNIVEEIFWKEQLKQGVTNWGAVTEHEI